MSFFQYIGNNSGEVLSLLLEHIQLTALAVVFSILIGVPLGILITYVKKSSKLVLGLANVVQAIPSMALLGFAIPLLGIGILPAVVVVILYSLLPIIKNTYTGIENIDPGLIEVAKGIGMTKAQILRKVQIPMALPVIMAGVRISAVTAVGLMTMAAFIGAGGLGYLVFSGIRTLNNSQILAGAIPACLLALLIDFIMGLFEKIVTPVGLKHSNRSPVELKKSARRQKIILGFTGGLLALIFLVTGVTSVLDRSDKTMRVAGKDFTEQVIACHLLSELIEDRTDIKVIRQPQLGGTNVVYGALKSGETDLYLDYTGTVFGSILSYPMSNDSEYIYETVKTDMQKEKITVLDQMNFNNTYTLAVKQETADQYNLRTISDLAAVSNQLTLASTFEFANRDDGLLGLTDVYPDLKFKNISTMDASLRFTALEKGEVQVIDAFATDGLLNTFDLVVLEDDKGFFLPYYAIPMMRDSVAETYPEIIPIIEELGTHLTDEVMRELNYQVDDQQRDPKVVAKEYLVKIGLIGG